MAGSIRESALSEAIITTNSSGDAVLVAGVLPKNILIFKMFLVVGSDVNMTFKNGTIALTGPIPMKASGSFVLDFDERPWFTTDRGQNFILNLDGSVQVSGRLFYLQQ